MSKIKSNGNQLFNIPNTPEGHALYAQMKKVRQKGYQFLAHGRGKNRKQHGGTKSHLAIHKSEWFAVYVIGPRIEEFKKGYKSMYVETRQMYVNLRVEHGELLKSKETLFKRYEEQSREVQGLRQGLKNLSINYNNCTRESAALKEKVVKLEKKLYSWNQNLIVKGEKIRDQKNTIMLQNSLIEKLNKANKSLQEEANRGWFVRLIKYIKEK